MNQPQRVIGIDPGFGRVGYGVVEVEGRGKYRPVTYGCLETTQGVSFEKRLQEIDDMMQELIARYPSDVVMVEQLFFSKNVTTGLKVAHARGVVLLAAARAGIPVRDVNPLHVKQAITGTGGADKQQVQKMTQVLLGLKEMPKPDDAADALAVALCGFLY